MDQKPPNQPGADGGVRLGLICGFGAYVIWGLFPIYIKQLLTVSPLEVVAHRIAWSVPFGALIIAARKQWRDVLAAFASPRVLGLLALAALFIAGNWLIYVWTVVNGHVLQASLGYYINPLVFIAAGVFILGEKLNKLQATAVALAGAGVAVLAVGAGVFPWPSIGLALCFTAYGYIRKTTPVGAMPGLFVETVLLTPIALAYLFWLGGRGELTFGHESGTMDFLLALGGPVTVIPLLLFALAARRLRLTTIGFLQYIAPTGQFILGLYYGETFTLYHAICFGLIWTALLLTSLDAVHRNRVERAAGRAAAGLTQTASASPKN